VYHGTVYQKRVFDTLKEKKGITPKQLLKEGKLYTKQLSN
jgi:hypothetical protein